MRVDNSPVHYILTIYSLHINFTEKGRSVNDKTGHRENVRKRIEEVKPPEYVPGHDIST